MDKQNARMKDLKNEIDHESQCLPDDISASESDDEDADENRTQLANNQKNLIKYPKKEFQTRDGFNNERKFHRDHGHYTLSDLSNALAMNSEEKTMQRVLEEIIKNHPDLLKKKNSYGKIYYHTYYLEGRTQ